MCDTGINPFETEVIIATKIRREKNENCVEFSFHSISGLDRNNTFRFFPPYKTLHCTYLKNWKMTQF